MKNLLLFFFTSNLLFAQTIDTSFGTNGISLINTPNSRDITIDFITNPDRSIIGLGGIGLGSGGYGVAPPRVIYKISENATIDTSFGAKGSNPTPINSRLNHILRLKDGKFIVFDAYLQVVIQKFNENGTLDISFGDQGTLNLESTYATYFSANDAVEFENGQILIVGSSEFSPNKIRTTLLKINSDGSLDHSFGTAGKMFITINNSETYSNANNVFLVNNKIILTGTGKLTSNTPSNVNSIFALRLNQDGTYDNSFGAFGRLITTFSNDNTNYVKSVIDDESNLYIGSWFKAAGNSTTSSRIMKVNSLGQLDSTFGDTGIASYSFLNVSGYKDELMKSLTIGSHGIYMGGVYFESDFYYPDYTRGYISKFNLDGSPDLSFGNDGFYNSWNNALLQITSIKFDNKKRLVVSGNSTGTDRKFAIARFNIQNETLNTDTFTTKKMLKIYPNPTTDYLILKNETNSSNLHQYEIADVSGKVVAIGKFKNKSTINIQNLAKGIYFIKIKNLEGSVLHIEKIIKN